MLDRHLDDLQLVTCHLGAGCSLAAVKYGRSVDTTMGLTPLDGLVMATRSGSIDPGLLLHRLQARRHRCRRAGGRSGTPLGSPRTLRCERRHARRDRCSRPRRSAGDARARRLRPPHQRRIGTMLAALDGLDAVVFTGGVGEHAPEIRARAVRPFACLGLILDDQANPERAPTPTSRASTRPYARSS